MRILVRNHGPRARLREVARVEPGPCSPSTSSGSWQHLSLDFESVGAFAALSIEMTREEARQIRDLFDAHLGGTP
jgi:hypothetical protein